MRPISTRQDTRQRGFTLIELLITMSVLGILMAVAIPNLQSFIVSSRLSSNINGFIGVLNYARSEAVVRNQSVIVCPKTSATSNVCLSTQYWAEYDTEVFVDVDGNDAWSAGDVLLKTIPAIDVTTSQMSFNRMSPTTYIKFGAIGMSRSVHKFDMYAVGNAAYNAQYGRSICITKPGRARVIALSPSATTCSDF